MSKLKGNLCDFCQCPIGHIEFGDGFNEQSDFLLEETKRINRFRLGIGTGSDYDVIDLSFELCQDCYDKVKAKSDDLIAYIKSQKKDRPRIQVVKSGMEVSEI